MLSNYVNVYGFHFNNLSPDNYERDFLGDMSELRILMADTPYDALLKPAEWMVAIFSLVAPNGV